MLQHRPSLGAIRLTVEDDHDLHLEYAFASIAEAIEMAAFLREFLPKARYAFAPALH
ncbi:MAG: hypothetical protein AAGI34_11240 [Pseudomonadota bacterium]